MPDITAIKKDFPIFTTRPELVYLDSAATAQKPRQVIGMIENFYTYYNANVHRGIYELSETATAAYEGAREKVRAFLNARSTREIIFTSGTTGGINIIVRSFSGQMSGVTCQVLLSIAEHHSNIVPWQITNHELRIINYDTEFRLDINDLKKKLEQGVDFVAVTHVSNVLGTINPIKEIIALAHSAGAKVLIDGAQAVPHIPIDVQELDADFYVFSGHKMFGPTGIGVLYAKEALLEEMQPVFGGGDMIKTVRFSGSAWNNLPWKFEAGTPHIAGAIGLGAAVEYINNFGFDALTKYEEHITVYTLESLQSIEGLRIYGPQNIYNRLGVFSFTLEGIHAHDLASVLNEQHIAIRAGHHCCMPLHEEVIKQPATARVSLSFYNTEGDIDRLVRGIEYARKILK